jgi:hypothetical protein
VSAAQHTPEPAGEWTLQDNIICDGDDYYVCKVATAELGQLIVQCVNAHDKLVHFIERWTHEGHLQTFEDRERFRAAARELIAKATGNFDQATGFLPKKLERM